MQDLLQNNGKNFNKTYEKICNADGFHNFLGYNRKIFLSTIMRDKTLFGCSVDMYTELIRNLKPDYFMTLDCETYEGENNLAENELYRVLRESKEIITKCSNSSPIGLVKGACLSQIQEYSYALSLMNIKQMIFHIGDFLYRGDNLMIEKARRYASTIRTNCETLALYGIGSQCHFRKFYFADAFITQSHYVNAFYGQAFFNGKWHPCHRKVDTKLIMSNLREMNQSLEEIDKHKQRGLIQWAEAPEQIDSPTLLPDLEVQRRMQKTTIFGV
ncbi:MAG: hypothetical protein AABX38_04035 [Candidatus Micrarchaeota archaeon]